MKTEQEIVLQKKMFIIFSLIILLFTIGILNIHKSTVLAASKNDTVTTIHTNYIASEELFKIEVSGDADKIADLLFEENVSGEEIVETVETQQEQQNAEQENAVQDMTEQPVVQQVAEETVSQDMVASRGSYIRETNTPPTDYEKIITVKATAYCLCKKCTGKTPSSPGYGHTSSGLVIVPGNDMKVISVDPNVIPLGTEVYVEGYGYAIAADTGGAVKGNKIDVYKDTHALALQWGVRNVKVYILNEDEKRR